MSGRYFEQRKPVDGILHVTTRKITEMDNVLFSALTMNPQPMQIDEAFAKKSI